MSLNIRLHTVAQIHITNLPPTNERKSWPANKRAEAEIEFLDGFLDGNVLRGFTVWSNADDELYVTGPSRSYKQDGETKYYEFLRAKTKLLRDDFSAFVIAEYQRVMRNRAELAEAAADVA